MSSYLDWWESVPQWYRDEHPELAPGAGRKVEGREPEGEEDAPAPPAPQQVGRN